MFYLQYINKFRFKVPRFVSFSPFCCSLNKLIFIIFYLCCKWGWICKLCHGLVRSRIHILNYNKLNFVVISRRSSTMTLIHGKWYTTNRRREKKCEFDTAPKHCFPHTLVLISYLILIFFFQKITQQKKENFIRI